MIRLVAPTNDPNPWYRIWLDSMTLGLEMEGEDVELSTRPGPEISVLTRYQTYALLGEMPPRSAVLVEHATYSPTVLGVEPFDYDQPAIAAIAATSPSMATYIGHGARWIGFPYWNRRLLWPLGPRRRMVVFPQRIEEDNQPFVAVQMALELLTRGWAVTFATPTPPDEARYPVSSWRAQGIDVQQLDQAGLFRLLCEAEYAVSTTSHGSMITALYEAHLLGCKVIAPKGSGPRPPFSDAFLEGYPALAPGAAIEMIERGDDPEVDDDAFSPRACARRLLEIISDVRDQ